MVKRYRIGCCGSGKSTLAKKRHQMIASFTAGEFLSELSEGERIL